jgi:hypothetical protein
MIDISILAITSLLLVTFIGLWASILALRPTPAVIVQIQQQPQSSSLGALLALGLLMLIWLALAVRIL